MVEPDSDLTRVDPATDFWLMPALRTANGGILADRELAADRILSSPVLSAIFEATGGLSGTR